MHTQSSGDAPRVAGVSIIAGRPSSRSGPSFRSFNPTTGVIGETQFFAATEAEVGAACAAAWRAFRTRPDSQTRVRLLTAIAHEITQLGDVLVDAVRTETGLQAPRVAGERDRTVYQLNFVAEMLRDGSWREEVVSPGDETRKPVPRPHVRRVLMPLGPVAVFGASNFPLAYGVAGGDTASALGAGCPVVVKGHSAHPITGELVAGAIARAVASSGLDHGYFSFLHAGGERDYTVGDELVRNSMIRAVGFTGSVAGGTHLVKLAAARPVPIPVFAEMGSVNPVFVLPNAMNRDGAGIAAKLGASATNSGGQMCTCPGLVFIVDGPETATAATSFVDALAIAMRNAGKQVMLTTRTQANFDARTRAIAGAKGVREVGHSGGGVPSGAAGARALPRVFDVSLADMLTSETLLSECFGPATIVVRCPDTSGMAKAIDRLEGSLTASLFADEADRTSACALMPLLAELAGRLIHNGVPTGVEVVPAMVHSGPFPACSRPDSSAVGTLAIRRWCRPVAYQNMATWLAQ